MGNTFSNSCKANAHSQYDGPTQKALVFTKYGNPSEVMKVDDVPKATLKSSDDVLVKVGTPVHCRGRPRVTHSSPPGVSRRHT